MRLRSCNHRMSWCPTIVCLWNSFVCVLGQYPSKRKLPKTGAKEQQLGGRRDAIVTHRWQGDMIYFLYRWIKGLISWQWFRLMRIVVDQTDTSNMDLSLVEVVHLSLFNSLDGLIRMVYSSHFKDGDLQPRSPCANLHEQFFQNRLCWVTSFVHLDLKNGLKAWMLKNY